MKKISNKREVGALYEQQAAAFLQGQGYEIVERNYRCRIGEIDIIAKDGSYLVFVEVKYRTRSACGNPQEAVNYRKQRVISKVASYYCLNHHYSPEQPCRFDVVAILGEDTQLIKNAFEYRE